jgi:predicted acyl esterase
MMTGRAMKHGGYFLIFFCCALWAANAGTYTKQATLIAVPATAAGTTNGDTSATSSNNIQLDATVYIPDGATSPVPVVVVLHGFGESKDDAKVVLLAEDFASAGYVVLAPSLRGFGASDGLVSLAGPNEINDLKTIILAMQTGEIGHGPAVSIPVTSESLFGVTGISYGGGLTWELMRTHVAGLTAVMPIIGWTDLYQALSPNDVPKLTYTLGLFAGGYDLQNPNYAPQMFDWLGDYLDGKPEKTRSGDPESNVDWRSVIFDPADVTVPTFVIQGWRDFLFPSEQAATMFAATNGIPFFKLYVGGIGHPPASSDITSAEALYMRAQALRWFDQWLKGSDTGILGEPRVTLAPELTANWSSNALVQADTFPLPGTTTNTLFINVFGLTEAGPGVKKPRKLPATARGFKTFSSILKTIGVNNSSLISQVLAVNDIFNSGAANVLDTRMFTQTDKDAKAIAFNSDVLPADLNVVGLPVVQLYVSAGKPNAYYFVQIEERLTLSDSKLVTRGAFKDHASASKVPHLIQFSPFAVNHRFSAGSQIKLVIASRDYPFFLPNLKQLTVKIYRDASHPSALLLPVAP